MYTFHHRGSQCPHQVANKSYFQYVKTNNANMFPCKENTWIIFAKKTSALIYNYKERNAPKKTFPKILQHCACFASDTSSTLQICVGYFFDIFILISLFMIMLLPPLGWSCFFLFMKKTSALIYKERNATKKHSLKFYNICACFASDTSSTLQIFGGCFFDIFISISLFMIMLLPPLVTRGVSMMSEKRDNICVLLLDSFNFGPRWESCDHDI